MKKWKFVFIIVLVAILYISCSLLYQKSNNNKKLKNKIIVDTVKRELKNRYGEEYIVSIGAEYPVSKAKIDYSLNFSSRSITDANGKDKKGIKSYIMHAYPKEKYDFIVKNNLPFNYEDLIAVTILEDSNKGINIMETDYYHERLIKETKAKISPIIKKYYGEELGFSSDIRGNWVDSRKTFDENLKYSEEDVELYLSIYLYRGNKFEDIQKLKNLVFELNKEYGFSIIKISFTYYLDIDYNINYKDYENFFDTNEREGCLREINRGSIRFTFKEDEKHLPKIEYKNEGC